MILFFVDKVFFAFYLPDIHNLSLGYLHVLKSIYLNKYSRINGLSPTLVLSTFPKIMSCHLSVLSCSHILKNHVPITYLSEYKYLIFIICFFAETSRTHKGWCGWICLPPLSKDNEKKRSYEGPYSNSYWRKKILLYHLSSFLQPKK